MPEEKTETENEEVTWRDIDELLAEANATHFSKTTFRGKIVKIAWKELSEEESSAKSIDFDGFKDKPKKEQDQMLQAWIQEDVLAKIAKAGEVKGCFQDNKISKEVWLKLPQRIRVTLINDVLDTREELMKSFL